MIPTEMYNTYNYRQFETNNDDNYNLTDVINNSIKRVYRNTMKFYNQSDIYFHDTFKEINESKNISMFMAVIYGIIAYLVLTNIYLRCSLNNCENDCENDCENEDDIENDDIENDCDNEDDIENDNDSENEDDNENEFEIDIVSLIYNNDYKPFTDFKILYSNPPFSHNQGEINNELIKLRNLQKAQALVIRNKKKENIRLLNETINLKNEINTLKSKLKSSESMSNARVNVIKTERKIINKLNDIIREKDNEINYYNLLKTNQQKRSSDDKDYNLTKKNKKSNNIDDSNGEFSNIIKYSFSNNDLNNLNLKNINLNNISFKPLKDKVGLSKFTLKK